MEGIRRGWGRAGQPKYVPARDLRANQALICGLI
jgi:hypothetical protein